MMTKNPPLRSEQSTTPHGEVRTTTVCVADEQPTVWVPLKPEKQAEAGGIGNRSLSLKPSVGPGKTDVLSFENRELQLEQIGNSRVATTLKSSVASVSGVQAADVLLKPATLPSGTLKKSEPQPQMEIRVRAIYAVDDGVSPDHTLEQVQAIVSALVESANNDLNGTGFRFVTFVRHDVEIRNDTMLRKDVVLSKDSLAKLTSGTVNKSEGEKIIAAAQKGVMDHRNIVAGERPNTMLWLFSRGNGLREVIDKSGKFLKWKLDDDRGGSFSGGQNNFVALHENFLSSVEWARKDASRAVHEVGHYLGLGHTHREPFHDLRTLALPSTATATERFEKWKVVVADWLKKQLPPNSSAKQAQEVYDVDRGAGVLDTPADPGASLLELANEVAGFGSNSLGPVNSITLKVPGITGSVVFKPLRNNPMGYYLQQTADAMSFTDDQIKVMRKLLIEGSRRPLVAAQLGDTATPDIQVCAVWSPSSSAQRLTWGWKLEDHKAEHERMSKAGMGMLQQQAYTRNGQVLFDGIWNPGKTLQQICWGFTANDVLADIPKRAVQGMVPRSVQGYQHLDHGIRYNVIYEPKQSDSRILLGVTQSELQKEWNLLMPKGYRMTCLSSHVDKGVIRYSTVLRLVAKPQAWVTGWTLEDIAKEYGKRWNEGWRIRHISVVKIAAGHRWSAVFEPDTQNQLVYWGHVRERIAEIYDQMWAVDFKLRSMCTFPS